MYPDFAKTVLRHAIRQCYDSCGAEVKVMYRPLVVSLAAFVLVAVPRFLRAQDSCDKQLVVSEVSLPTTTHLAASEQAAIQAWLIGRCFDNQQLGELASGVSDVLQGIGYLHAAVPEPSITAFETSRHPQAISLHVEVKEGARYKVDDIELAGYRTVSPEQIIALSQIQAGDFFEREKVRETAEAVRKLYAARGYLDASIVPRTRFLDGAKVCLSFSVPVGEG
jgi:outer membrane protein assembly factor BamA